MNDEDEHIQCRCAGFDRFNTTIQLITYTCSVLFVSQSLAQVDLRCLAIRSSSIFCRSVFHSLYFRLSRPVISSSLSCSVTRGRWRPCSHVDKHSALCTVNSVVSYYDNVTFVTFVDLLLFSYCSDIPRHTNNMLNSML